MRLPLTLFCLLFAFGTISTNAQDFPPQRTLNSEFPFKVPENVKAWESRRQRLRDHLLTSLGLHPLPQRTDLNAKIFGKIEQPEYSIEKVVFESFPGYFVTGNLYRPKHSKGPAPGVLCPHGHHRDGRFRNASAQEIDAEQKSGAEKFRSNAQSILQARCAHLAKMGCVVFHYDMIGYADSLQIPMSIAHGFSTPRIEFNSENHYGFFSPTAELQMQSIMGLQTWNSIRSLDFLESLPDVDPDRIGVTGASGGGTQTFILCAIDDRPDVCFPAVMVSTAMQGGCTCENCSQIRINTGNVEFAAMFAPKPMGLTAANDWTREMETKGFPELKKLYSLLGAPNNVHLLARLEFGHNYNQVSREAMYQLFDRHLNLQSDTSESETPFLARDQLSVWDNQTRPKPFGRKQETQLLQDWRSLRENSLMNVLNQSSYPAGYLAARYGDLLGTRLSMPQLEFGPTQTQITGAQSVSEGSAVDENGNAFRWRSTNNLDSDASPNVLIVGNHKELARELVASGCKVTELLPLEKAKRNQLVNNGRKAAGYTFGYNPTLFAARTRQVIAYVNHLNSTTNSRQILIGTGDHVGIAMVAATQVRNQLDGLILDGWDSFSFQDHSDLESPNFLPGSMAYFGMSGYQIVLSELPVLATGTNAEKSRLRAELQVIAEKRENGNSKPLHTFKLIPGDQLIENVGRWLESQKNQNR